MKKCEKCGKKLRRENGNLSYFSKIVCDECEGSYIEDMNAWLDKQAELDANFDDYYNDNEFLKGA